MRYLFDTDTISFLAKPKPPERLVHRIALVADADQFISAITVLEICYGAYRSANPRKHLQFLEQRVLPRVGVLDFDDTAARVGGRIRADRERTGKPIAPLDLQTAAIAVASGCILVTGNREHFANIDGLDVEDWIR